MTNRVICARARVTDLENNVCYDITFMKDIPNGVKDSNISLTLNSALGGALRQAISRVITEAEIGSALRKVVEFVNNYDKELAMKGKLDITKQAYGAVQYFVKQGVLAQKILDKIGIPSINDMTVEHVNMLRGFANAIKEGATVDEIFHSEYDNELPDTKETQA